MSLLSGQPALADEPEGEVPAELVQAVEADLGMSWEEFVQAGAQVEAAAPQIEEGGGQSVGVMTGEGIGIRATQTLGDAGEGLSPFTDLEELRTDYLREVGPDGLTGLVVTLDGYEVMVADPETASDRGRTDTAAPLVSPAEWGREHGVNVTGTSGDPSLSATLRGGAPIAFGGVGCSHGFNGWYKGETRGIAAGHCVNMGGTRVTSGSSYLGTVDWWQFGAPGSGWETYGTDLATYSISSTFATPAQISSQGGPLTITGRAAAVLGMPVCKQGRMTGWTCSKVNKIGWQWIGDGSGDITRPKRWVWSLFADTRIIPGDSGGPWVSGRKAVGITSSYDWYDNGNPYATASLLTSLDEYRPGAQVKVWLGRAHLPSATYSDDFTARARWAQGATVSGAVTRLSSSDSVTDAVVDVLVDGARVASPRVAPDGSFSFVYPGSDSASHSVTFQARSGDSRGPVVTVQDQPAGIVPKVIRHDGSDRYAAAAGIVLSSWTASTSSTVYIASGEKFPDALSGSALAGAQDAPVLLTRAGALPPVTRDAILKLAPERVVILGGTSSVSGTVATELAALVPSVSRISGADRYEVAANIAATYPSASTVYISSGLAFADGLAASARAGAVDLPLLLTETSSLPESTIGQLARLRPARVVVIGGPVSVSTAVESQLKAYAGEVVRVAGADRYEVAANVAGLFPVPSSQVWVAKGTDFPDALAAAPAAALNDSPVVLTKPTTLPSVTSSAIKRLKPPQIHVAGGPSSVAERVVDALRWMTFQ